MKELKISKEYLKQINDHTARLLVGKCLKRLEIIEDRTVLKNNIKEIIYEGMRDYLSLFMAYQEGREIVEFRFTKQNRD